MRGPVGTVALFRNVFIFGCEKWVAVKGVMQFRTGKYRLEDGLSVRIIVLEGIYGDCNWVRSRARANSLYSLFVLHRYRLSDAPNEMNSNCYCTFYGKTETIQDLYC